MIAGKTSFANARLVKKVCVIICKRLRASLSDEDRYSTFLPKTQPHHYEMEFCFAKFQEVASNKVPTTASAAPTDNPRIWS